MNLKKAHYTIELEYQEMLDLFFSLKRNLVALVESHYTRLQQKKPNEGKVIMREQESSKFRYMNLFAGLLGRADLMEGTEYEINQIFDRAQKEYETKTN